MNDSLPPDDHRNDDQPLPGVPVQPGAGRKAARFSWLRVGALLVTILGLGFLIILPAINPAPGGGATRSSKLKWEQRQIEMDQAEHDAQSSADQNR
jgi:hypothetical protein